MTTRHHPHPHPHRRPLRAGRTSTRAAALVVAAILAVVGTACAGDGGDDKADASSVGLDSTTPIDSSTDTTEGEDGDTGDDTGDDGDDAVPGDATPQDAALDVDVRHPNGTTFRMTEIRFEGNDIFVDAEIINGYSRTITLFADPVWGERLRLVDEDGETYSYIPAGEGDPDIDLAAGESIEGTFAFRGPLHGQPRQLTLAVNAYDEDIEGFDLAAETEHTDYPRFVIPLELTWA